MKLPKRRPCRWGPRRGNSKTTATLVESLADGFSDRSSTLLGSTTEKAQIFWAFCCFCVFPAVKSCGEKVRILGILDVSYKEIAHEISKKISRR